MLKNFSLFRLFLLPAKHPLKIPLVFRLPALWVFNGRETTLGENRRVFNGRAFSPSLWVFNGLFQEALPAKRETRSVKQLWLLFLLPAFSTAPSPLGLARSVKQLPPLV
jgi:hypothetical protein